MRVKIASLKRRKVRMTSVRRGQREATLEGWCNDRAKERGWRSRKMNGLGFRDWPDRLYVRPPKRGVLGDALVIIRRPVWVEFKKLGEEPTANQAILHTFLRRCGEDVRVIDNRDDFRRLLDE